MQLFISEDFQKPLQRFAHHNILVLIIENKNKSKKIEACGMLQKG